MASQRIEKMKIKLSRKEFLTIYNALCYQQICLRNESLKEPPSEKTIRKINLIDSLCNRLMQNKINNYWRHRK